MPAPATFPSRVRIAFALLVACAFACATPRAQQPDTPASQPETTTLPSGIARLAGKEPTSQIQYVRLMVNGSLHSAAKGVPDPPPPTPPPVLIAQCTLRPTGKYMFELFSSFGGEANLAFFPPWKASSSQDLFPPRTDKATLTMDFLGYTKVKPVRSQWENPVEAPVLYRYNPPGFGSPNIEEASYYLRYLLSLPTLRLTLDKRAAEFMTTPLLTEIHKEPLCRAAGI